MFEDENKEAELPTEVDVYNKQLEDSTNKIVKEVVSDDGSKDIKDLVNMFNLNIVKKNILRVNQLNGLLDNINSEAIKRFINRSDEISNKELLDFMNSVQSQIEKSQKYVDSVNSTPAIQINQQNNINITNETSISEEEQHKILEIIKQFTSSGLTNDIETNIIDSEVSENDINENKGE